MKLSELHTGQHGTILKVRGHGGFRKRIVEMGFIKGQTVEVLLNAPLQDPVKYRIMGYEVSLRRQEAEMIEVETNSEVKVSKPGDEALLYDVESDSSESSLWPLYSSCSLATLMFSSRLRSRTGL